MLILVSCGILMGMLVGSCLLLPDLLRVIAVIAVTIDVTYRLIKKGALFIYGKIVAWWKR